MTNFITNYFRKRKRRQLVAQIAQVNPEWAGLPDEECLIQYIYSTMSLFMEQQQIYRQACLAHPALDSFSSEPEMPWLLMQALMYWTDHPGYIYAMILVQKDLELVNLRPLAQQAEQVKSISDQQEKITRELTTITERVEKEIERTHQAIRPENRLN